MSELPPYGGTGSARDIALPAAAAALALFLPFSLILAAYIVLGQAHFFMAYRYQLRGKRMTTRYLLVALALVFLASLYLAAGAPAAPLLAVAGILFAAHFSMDEFTLHGEAPGRASVVGVAGFTALFAVLVLSIVLPAREWIFAYPAVIAGYALVRLFLVRARPTTAERYLWLVGALLVFLAFVGLSYQTLGVIVLLHVINWYLAYGKRVAARPERARAYWIEVAATLALMLALFLGFTRLGWTGFAILFSPMAYYLWAVAHIVLSLVAAIPERGRAVA